jgi:predicted Fe-Mo cluster-binding NifX family protein
MKIAVTAWEDRVSPVFDTARQVTFFEVADHHAKTAGEMQLGDEDPARRIQRLKDMGVDAIICGAISQPVAASVQVAGIRLIPFVAGPVVDVLKAYLEGTLTAPAFRMPGCCGARRRFRGGRKCD